MTDYVVVEVSRRGRMLVGEPVFTPGVPIPLDKHGLGDLGSGDLAVVRKQRGRARLERALGPADRIENVLEALLEHEGLRHEFEPFDLPEPSLEGRVDLRDLLTFTIDPETAKDFDDAISTRREGDGIRVWVHIADVSWFVPAGSPLDRGAAERALSVYVPGFVAPMLPHELADDACSLRPNVDRLCVTVEILFDGSLQAGEATFYRSAIRSNERLTYGQAESILAGRERAAADVTEGLKLAETIALELRRRRFARGALRISSAEIAFAFDGEGGVEKAWLESEPHAHVLIEELMILANEAVAGLLAGRKREALFRVHERPEPLSVTRLLAKLTPVEVPTPPAPDADHMSPQQAAAIAAEASERVSEYVARGKRGREAFPVARAARRSSRRATTRRTSATRVLRAPRTATSRRRSAAIRTSSCTARCSGRSARPTSPARGHRGLGRARSVKEREPARRRVPRRRYLPRVAARGRAPRARLGGRRSRARSRG